MIGWIAERLADIVRLLDYRASEAWQRAREADDAVAAAWHAGRASMADEAAALIAVLARRMELAR